MQVPPLTLDTAPVPPLLAGGRLSPHASCPLSCGPVNEETLSRRNVYPAAAGFVPMYVPGMTIEPLPITVAGTHVTPSVGGP